jgi:hypothetical protein
MPGRYWAFVEFTKKVRFTKKDSFALDDSAPDQSGSGDAEDGAMPAEAAGEGADAAAGGAGDASSKGPTDADPTPARISRQFTEKRFKEGEKAEFDLQTALELQNDKQWVRITSVTERRPLSDPFTAIRGSAFSAKTADGQPVRAEGIDAIRQGLLVEMTSIDQATTRVKVSHDNVEAQTAAVAEETKQLQGDLTSWEKDVSAATDTAQAFDDRLRAATIELAALENSIVRLGKELAGAWGTLTETIDNAAR